MTKFKPLLADAAELDKLDYSSLLASPKLDGIRAIVIGGVVMSRNLKPIRNAYVQSLFGRPEYEHLDGELIVGDPCAKDCYQVTNSGVMSAEGQPDVRFFAFDHVEDPSLPFLARYSRIYQEPFVHKVTQTPIGGYDALLAYEERQLNLGYEGVMLRAAHAPYKFGRSTPKEGILLKLKRFVDGEAKVIGVLEEMENRNQATTDALGRTERSSHAENKVGKGRMGALLCETPDGIKFNIGTGFTAKQREQFWTPDLLGRTVKYKSFPIGVKDAPRFPVFLGWRDPIDM